MAITKKEGILIVGSGGMIGGYLARALGKRAVCPSRMELPLGDPRDLATFLHSRKLGAIINATGAAGKSFQEMFQVHGFLARTLAEAARMTGAACVYLSSSRVFSGLDSSPYMETDKPDPRDDYGLSKFLGERFTLNGGQDARGYVVRLPMVLGLRPEGTGRQLAHRALDLACKGSQVRIADDILTQAVHAEDLCLALSRMLDEGLPPGVYHLSGPGPASLHAIISRLFAACGLEPPVAAAGRDFQPEGHLAHNLSLAPGRLGQVGPWERAVDRFAAELRGRE